METEPRTEDKTGLFLAVWAFLTVPVTLVVLGRWVYIHQDQALLMFLLLPLFGLIAGVIAAVLTLVPAATLWLFIRLGQMLWRAINR